ncbi:hypothetical protein ABPG74_000008 [Tetrahymena malaccensis]
MASNRRSSAEPGHSESVTIIEEVQKEKGVIRRYQQGRFLGKGGFAKCYEFTNLEGKQVLAAKIIPKSSLTKNRARQKLMSEIKIHKSLNHRNIVQFLHFFEDSENVYILLEKCANQTMNELIKRRKRLTELEAQCYLLQILYSIKYLHNNRVIHRDLKLGNLFLSDQMEIKLGDFGLATKLEYDGERKRTICGTPNYIAPEILEGKEAGHSYEVDVWSFGVIAYTLLIGKPPFETNDVKSTYKKIRTNEYSFPEQIQISSAAKNMIKKILVTEPTKRPSLDDLFNDDFFKTGGSIPKLLPVSTLACPPSVSYIRQFLPSAQFSSSSNQKAVNNQADKNSSPKKFDNTTPINRNGFTRFATQTSYNPQNIKSQQQMGLKERKDYINTYRTGGAQTSSSSGLCNSQYGQKNFDTHSNNNQKIDNFMQANKNTYGLNGSVAKEQCFQKSQSLNPQSEGTVSNLNIGMLNFTKSHSTNTQQVEGSNLKEDYIQKMDEYNQKIQPQIQNPNQHKSEDFSKNGCLSNQKYTSQANQPQSQTVLNSIQSQVNVKNISNSTSIGNFAYNQSTATNSNANLLSTNLNNLSGGASSVSNQNYQSQHKNYPSQQSTNAVFNRNSIEKYSSSNNISSGNSNYTRAKSEKMHTQPTSSLLQAYGFTKVEQAPSSGTTALNFNNSGSYFQAPASSNEVQLKGPDIWVQKWVDYSSKYGLGYLLNNGQAGVFFNDSTKIILNPKTGKFDYIERNSANKQDFGSEYSIQEYPQSIQKKLTLLQHFRSFLEGDDKKQDPSEKAQQVEASSESKSSKIYVKKWLRTKNAILFRLSNKVVQVIFQDTSEIILSSELRAVTYVNRKKERETFPLSTAMESQNKEMSKRLTYTKDILTHMLGGASENKNEKHNNENIPNQETISTTATTNPLGTINLNQDGKEKNHSKNQTINPNSCSSANLYPTTTTTTQYANNNSSSQIQPSQKPSTRENLHYSKNVPLSSVSNSLYMQNQQSNPIYNNYTQNENINVMLLNKQQSLQQQKSTTNNGYELNGFASSNSANKKEKLTINSNVINSSENKCLAQPTNIQNLLKSNSTIGRMNSMNPTATSSLSNLNNFNNYVMSSRKTEV